MNAAVIETGSTGATWLAASMAWLGLAEATLSTMGITGGQMAASVASISGMRSAAAEAATPPFLAWLGTMAGIAFKQAAVTATVAQSYGMTRTTMIPSVQSINNRVREAAAEASNFFGQNTPLIAALNAEYAGYTMLNATLGTTYGQVITAATLPIPIPPPPPLGNAARAAADAGAAVGKAGQLAAQAGSQSLTQATQASSQVSQGAGATNPMGAMGQMTQLFQAPMQALQPLMQAPMQLMQQVLGPATQLFGQASGMGNMFGGGSTGDAFSPLVTGGGGGLPLGGAGLAGGAGAGGGIGAGGGGGIGAAGGGGGLGAGGLGSLSSKAENATITRGGAVLSGVTTPGMASERVATAGGGGGMPMGHGGQGAGSGDRVRRDAVMTSSPPSFLDLPRRT